ncbi:zinc/cadmium/mercury/lead-transporting ATPase [Enterobacteriaceae bacterium LUAb1]
MMSHHHNGCDHPHSSQKTNCHQPAHPHQHDIMTTMPNTDNRCDQGENRSSTRNRPDLQNTQEWLVDGMDCPSCAQKIENAVSQIPGVSKAQVLFATEKLRVVAERNVSSEITLAVNAAGFTLRQTHSAPAARESLWQENRFLFLLTLLMGLSAFINAVNTEYGKLAFTITTIAGVIPVIRSAWRLIRQKTFFAIETLMSIAAIGALIIGATAEAAMVLLLFMLGERLESFAARQARKGITALMALKPETALRLSNGIRETVAVSTLRPGDIIEVAAGARLPADALLRSEDASFDESALTGESIPVERQVGERLTAGSLSVDRLVQVEVISQPGESAIDRILQLIENAESRRAPVERFMDTFSRYYTPIVLLLAGGVALFPPLFTAAPWLPWIYKALALLLIGCPCALVISIPAAVTSGLAAAARFGALIKGGATLENLSRIRTLAFDKTGTLTVGKPQVTEIVLLQSAISEDTVLAQAATIEQGSSHPLAQAIVRCAEQKTLPLSEASQIHTLTGSGIAGFIDGQKILLSSPARLANDVLNSNHLAHIAELESHGKTVIVQINNDEPVALYALLDCVRAEAHAVLAELKELNIQSIMLTGDNARAASAIATELGIDYQAGLLPVDKVNVVTTLNQQQPVAMVGDGINDAPAMKAASVGIAMGSGSDVALETADAALTRNHLGSLPAMIRLARATHANIRQNVTLALGLKALFLITTLLGITGLWLAVLADSGATALVTANALRLLRKK